MGDTEAIVAKKEADYAVFEMTMQSLKLQWLPKNRYEQWKRDRWPAWLKRFQPVKYGWVKVAS